jgi:uncharacterized protein
VLVCTGRYYPKIFTEDNTMMKGNCSCKCMMLTKILVTVGALNWGLVGAFQYDLVAELFGGYSLVARVIYILVGVAGLMMLMKMFGKSCPMHKGTGGTTPAPSNPM